MFASQQPQFKIAPDANICTDGDVFDDLECQNWFPLDETKGSDPFAPLADLDSIFDETSKSRQSLPKQPLMTNPSLKDLVNGAASMPVMPASSHFPRNLFRTEVSQAATVDLLSEVLQDLDQFTADETFCPVPTQSSSAYSPITPAPVPSFLPAAVQNTNSNKRSLVADSQCADQANKKRKLAQVSDSEGSDDAGIKFRYYQAEKWQNKFEELVDYKKRHGHCRVPHGYKPNPMLARWAKRQRYQFKLFREGKPSTMTEERISALEQLGFVWDSHSALWEERYSELRDFCRTMGHANVPSTFPSNPKLAIWVKCQRRQYKLLANGQSSNMTLPRVNLLNQLGFVWEVRRGAL